MLFSCNNCYYHFAGGTRGHYEANSSTYPRGQDGPILHARSGFPRINPAQENNCVKRTLLDNVGDEVEKSGRRMIQKEHVIDSGGFIVL